MDAKRMLISSSAALALLAAVPARAAEEVRWSTRIRPVFEQKCAPCHGDGAPEYGEFAKDEERYKKIPKGPRMDTHAHLVHFTGWPDTGALMRRLDDGTGRKDGKPGSMYQYLGSDEAERQKNLSLFKAWGGNWTLKRFGEVTKQDLAGIQAKY
jgi:cytochrome c5